MSPFNLKTEERNAIRKRVSQEKNCKSEGKIRSESKDEYNFRAREMPKYNFFEVRHGDHKKVLFQEFNLSTMNRYD